MNRVYIIYIVISKYHPPIHCQRWKKGSSINVLLYTSNFISSRNSMIPLKNLPIKCGVLLLVALSINDVAYSLGILASLLSLRNIVLNLLYKVQYSIICSVFHP